MKNSTIVLSNNPVGRFLEGTVDGTPKPGTWMQIKANTTPVGGRHTWTAYAPSADGDPRLVAILIEDWDQGKTVNDAYVSGTRCFLYCPIAGDELNILVKGQPGTGSANAFFIGDRLGGDTGTGKFQLESTSSKFAPFVCLEHIDEVPNTDTLVWAMSQGQ